MALLDKSGITNGNIVDASHVTNIYDTLTVTGVLKYKQLDHLLDHLLVYLMALLPQLHMQYLHLMK